MTNTETIKSALIKQIIDSGSTLPLSLLEGNIDLLINTALTERYDAIYNKVIGSHITEPNSPLNDLKCGEWYVINEKEEWLVKFQYFGGVVISVYKYVCLNDSVWRGNHCTALCHINNIKSIRPATREEIIKYFPHEFEVDAHGANDIAQLTDPHI